MQKQPVRMCVLCRERSHQNELLRLQIDNGKLIHYKGFGRSFYVCSQCRNDEKRKKSFSKRFKIEKERIDIIFKGESF
jgi:predicted RNA-binding protein YlxR (DUF448 family)